MNDDEKSPHTEKGDPEESIDIAALLDKHNSVQILGLIGALQLHAINHGRNFRFEQLARETLLQFHPNDQRPLATWDTLKSTIEGFSEGSYMEDPLSNAFTEIAFFEEGNYTVASGIYVGHVDVLNCMIEAMFLTKNGLPEHFVKDIRSAAGLLLLMSDVLFKEAGHEPYIHQRTKCDDIQFPEYDKAVEYTNANYFSIEYLKQECERRRYNFDVLEEFSVVPGSKDIEEEDPELNVVNFKPLVKIQDDILVYMPTAIVPALVAYIYRKAKEIGLYDQLLEMYYDRQFDLVLRALKHMGWYDRMNFQLPGESVQLPIDEAVYRIDNQKLGYVCYLKPNEDVDLQNPFSESSPPEIIKDRVEKVIDHLSKIEPSQPFQVFCLFILGEAAQDFMFAWPKAPENHLSLSLKYSELIAIAYAGKVNRLSLWKFAKCYNRTTEHMRIMAFGGILDAYVIYVDNQGSLLHTDHENPLGGMMVYTIGSSDDFKREVQKKIHEHTIPIFHEQQLAYAISTRYKQYAPIYQETEVRKDFRLAIETYRIPIWVVNQQKLAERNGWAEILCESVAFWLHKMKEHLSAVLDALTFVAFEIDIVLEDRLLTTSEYERKSVEPVSVKINCTVDAPRIKIEVPFDFIYLVKRPDNIADKMLMEAVLNGLVLYVHTAKGRILLDQVEINRIIEAVMQPSHAKMVLFSDATLNVKMDARNLPPVKFIHASDVSYVLDNLVSYLPAGYAIPAKIAAKADKIKVCDDVVAALAGKISTEIEKLDGPQLLEWLIRANEKNIQYKEYREIVVPARMACFSTEQDEIEEMMDKDRDGIVTGHALRTLIEFVAIKVPKGSLWANHDSIDELLALTHQLIEWGALSEAMRMGLQDPGMGLLPSGRIGTEKTLEREAFKPYAVAKAESDLYKYGENFADTYAPDFEPSSGEGHADTSGIDAAWLAEKGVTLSKMFRIIGEMVNLGFTSATACVKIKEDELMDLLVKIKGITRQEIEATISVLTLIDRPDITTPPASYQYSDIFPWRYNRDLSYLRRPLVRLDDGGHAYYYFGYRHLLVYMDNLEYLLHSAKYQNPVSLELKTWISEVSGTKGNPFRKAVKEWFETNTDFEVIQHEVKMTPDKELKTDKPYGDIDVMVIDHQRKIIYSIECKNITGGRNIHEMKVEMDEYLGREGQKKKGKIYLHLERDNWLQKNPKSLTVFGKELETYHVRSLILTADEIPLSYLKGELPLPVRSFVFLKKHGVSILD